MNIRSSLWRRNQEPSASKRLLLFCSREWSVKRFVLDICLPLLGLNGMSRLSSKEAFSLRCVLRVLVEMIRHSSFSLNLFSTSLCSFTFLCLFQFSLSWWNLSEDKSWRQQAETRIFQLPLLSSCKHQSEAQCLFCFCYHSCMKKNVHKRAVCWLAVTGRTQRAEWRDSEGRETEFSFESWKMLFPIQCFLRACLPMVVSGLFTESTHEHMCLTCWSVPLTFPPRRDFLFFYLSALTGKIKLRNWESAWKI